jgi:hypothetical protein
MAASIHLTALKVTIAVGTLLAAINYGDKLIAGSVVSTDWTRLALTYFVPYAVSWYSANAAKGTST